MGTYTYTSGISFSYKFWHVRIEESFMHYRAYFYLSGMDIYFSLMQANPQISYDSPRAKRLMDEFMKHGYELIEDHACKFHTFGLWKKLQQDAMEYIDRELGDGWTYMQKHHMIDLSKF